MSELQSYLKIIQPKHHVCLFYDSLDRKHKVVYEFLAEGINNGKGIIYIHYDETLDEIRKGLQAYGVDVGPNERSGNLKILHFNDWYMPKGKVEVLRIIKNWKKAQEEFHKKGLGMRVAGEMSGFFDNGKVKDLVRYEYALHRLLDIPMEAICSYNVNTILRSGYSELIMPLVRAHGKAIFSSQGGIMILEPDDVEDYDIERLLDIKI